jgi:hypothetical protein
MDKEQQTGNSGKQNTSSHKEQQPRSSAFKEPGNMDQKSNTNPEEEADLEQQRKEALTERD